MCVSLERSTLSSCVDSVAVGTMCIHVFPNEEKMTWHNIEIVNTRNSDTPYTCNMLWFSYTNEGSIRVPVHNVRCKPILCIAKLFYAFYVWRLLKIDLVFIWCVCVCDSSSQPIYWKFLRFYFHFFSFWYVCSHWKDCIMQ